MPSLPAPSFQLPALRVGSCRAGSRKREAGSFMKLTDVIRRPLVTEKTTLIREDNRTLVFQVATGATKVDIRRAVEKLFGTNVELVRTAISHGKIKRQGRDAGGRIGRRTTSSCATERRSPSSWKGLRRVTSSQFPVSSVRSQALATGNWR